MYVWLGKRAATWSSQKCHYHRTFQKCHHHWTKAGMGVCGRHILGAAGGSELISGPLGGRVWQCHLFLQAFWVLLGFHGHFLSLSFIRGGLWKHSCDESKLRTSGAPWNLEEKPADYREELQPSAHRPLTWQLGGSQHTADKQSPDQDWHQEAVIQWRLPLGGACLCLWESTSSQKLNHNFWVW